MACAYVLIVIHRLPPMPSTPGRAPPKKNWDFGGWEGFHGLDVAIPCRNVFFEASNSDGGPFWAESIFRGILGSWRLAGWMEILPNLFGSSSHLSGPKSPIASP